MTKFIENLSELIKNNNFRNIESLLARIIDNDKEYDNCMYQVSDFNENSMIVNKSYLYESDNFFDTYSISADGDGFLIEKVIPKTYEYYSMYSLLRDIKKFSS